MKQPHVLFFMCDQMQYQRQGRIDIEEIRSRDVF